MHPASALQACSAYPILPSLVSGHGEGKQQQTIAIMFFLNKRVSLLSTGMHYKSYMVIST